ncbi:MAG: hypothetical protein IJL26_04975 [Clostridia bacterium]|nr:hypothetical protein [Clostridia bacterium]
MRKNLFRLLAAVLCLALMIPAASLAASAVYDPATQDYSIYPELGDYTPADAVYPTIILPGINQSDMVYCDGNGEPMLDADGNRISGGVILIDSTQVKSKVLKLIPPLLMSLAMQQSSATLADTVYNIVHEILAIQQMDNDGETVNNLVLESFDGPISEYPDKDWFYRMLPMEPVAKMIGEENVYLYTFPLFGDPVESGEKLRGFIDNVKSRTGSEKVNLVTISLGGSILTAYLDQYPDCSDINKIINIVSVLGGTDIMADFMDRRFNISDEFLYSEYVPMIMKETSGSASLGYLINILLRILPKQTFYDILTAAFSAVLDTVILNDPQFWAMLPGDRYEALADRYLHDGEHDALLAKTDRYQKARMNLKDNLSAAAAAGVKVFNIAGYDLTYADGDYNYFGIVKSTADANCDGIIPIGSTTLGATSVPTGTQFDKDYLDAADPKYISPDKSVDASTCLFPDRTWFFDKQHHEVGRDDKILRLITAIVGGYADTVDSMPAFPQFNVGRYTRPLIRSDGGLVFKAQAVLNDIAGTYTDEQKANVRPAYDDTLAMLKDTTGGEDAAASVKIELQNALADIGVGEHYTDSNTWTKSALEMLMKFLNDLVMKSVGGPGSSDFVKNLGK